MKLTDLLDDDAWWAQLYRISRSWRGAVLRVSYALDTSTDYQVAYQQATYPGQVWMVVHHRGCSTAGHVQIDPDKSWGCWGSWGDVDGPIAVGVPTLQDALRSVVIHHVLHECKRLHE